MISPCLPDGRRAPWSALVPVPGQRERHAPVRPPPPAGPEDARGGAEPWHLVRSDDCDLVRRRGLLHPREGWHSGHWRPLLAGILLLRGRVLHPGALEWRNGY